MPTFLRMAEILFCSMADFIPYLFLLFYPFRNHMRLKGFFAGLLTLPLSAAVLYCDIHGALGIPALLPMPLLLLRSGAFLLMVLISVHANLWKMLLNTFSVINFSILIHTAAGLAAEPFTLRWFAVTLALQTLLLIPYGVNLAKCLGPTLNLSTAPVWGFLWLIPAAASVAGCVMLHTGAAAKTLTVTMAAATVLAAAAAAAALYFTKTEMITVILKKRKATRQVQPEAAPAVQETNPVQLYYANLQTRMAELEHSHKELFLQVMSMEDDLDQQDYEKLRLRLSFMRKQLSATAEPSGNNRIDPILTYYTRQALLRSIKIVTSVALPAWSEIADEDLAVLISCLMDNALEACAEQTSGTRRIAAATNQKGDMLQIGIKNTCSGPADADSERLNICRRIARQYNGDMRIAEGDGVTQIVVTLNI